MRRPSNRVYVLLGFLLAGTNAMFYAVTGGAFNAVSYHLQPSGYLAALSGSEGKLPLLPPLFWALLSIPIAVLAATLALLLVRALGAMVGHLRQPRDPALVVLVLCGLGMFGLTFVTALYQDTYLLPLLPALIVFLLSRARGGSVALGAAWIVLVCVAVVSLVNLREYYNWRATAWQAGQTLVAAGVPAGHISAGFEWDYWYLWEAAVREAQAAGQPINFGIHHRLMHSDYVLSFTPAPRSIVDAPPPDQDPAYTVCARIPYTRPTQSASGYLYVLSTIARCP